MTKVRVSLKPCPWCKKTPRIFLPYDYEQDDTWQWTVRCNHNEKDHEIFHAWRKIEVSVSVRKDSKKYFWHAIHKIEDLVFAWNEGLDTVAYESIEVDLTDLERNMEWHYENLP